MKSCNPAANWCWLSSGDANTTRHRWLGGGCPLMLGFSTIIVYTSGCKLQSYLSSPFVQRHPPNCVVAACAPLASTPPPVLCPLRHTTTTIFTMGKVFLLLFVLMRACMPGLLSVMYCCLLPLNRPGRCSFTVMATDLSEHTQFPGRARPTTVLAPLPSSPRR